MGKIYDKDGKKMNVTEICGEVMDIITEYEISKLYGAMERVQIKDAKPLESLSHAILDVYKYIESTSERGQRLRKLLDNIMTKYQKSVGNVSEEDNKSYTNLINMIKGIKDE